MTDPLEGARKVQDIRPDTVCSFAGEDPHADEDIPSLSTPGLRSSGPMVAIEDELSAEVVESTSTHGVIKFWPWVQQVMLPLSYKTWAALIVDLVPTRPH